MRASRWLMAAAAFPLIAPSTRAQTPELEELRFEYAMEAARVAGLVAERDRAFLWMESLCGSLAAVNERGTDGVGPALVDVAIAADSVAYLNGLLADAVPRAREVGRELAAAIDRQLRSARDSARCDDADRRAAWRGRAAALARELEQVRRPPPVLCGPAMAEAGSGTTEGATERTAAACARRLSAAAEVVAAELAQATRRAAVTEELRRLAVRVQLFDEAGIPPTQAGDGDAAISPPGGSCPGSCRVEPVAITPGDLPILAGRSDVARRDEVGEGARLSAATLERVEAELLSFAAGLQRPIEEFEATVSPATARPVPYEISLGPQALLFESGATSTLAMAARTSGSYYWSQPLGSDLALTVEPRVGLRAFALEYQTSAELIGEVEETLGRLGAAGGVQWQLAARQKARTLSEEPSLPAYLEPGRGEAWLGGRLALPLVWDWQVDAEAGAGLVRYGPSDWRVLDHDAVSGALGVGHPLAGGIARVAVAGGAEDFVDSSALERRDERAELRVDWSGSGKFVGRLEAGLAWNESTQPGFDYRAQRAGVLLGAPLGDGSIHLYAVLARKDYSDQGSADARVAPSDRDTGSFAALQLTRPLPNGAVLRLQAEWSRSETGFRDVFYQRLGLGAMYSLYLGG